MAHWAKLDENNTVVYVTVTDNNDPNGDEGYQWLMENFPARWVKTSYNTRYGKHGLGGVPFRGNYAGIGYTYNEEIDAFLEPKPYPSWIVDTEHYCWKTPTELPDSGMWEWNEEAKNWTEMIYE